MKKVLSFILSVVMFVTMFSFSTVASFAGTNGKSSSDAINWLKLQVGQALDYDGVAGAQCVDLIAYYYKFLGATTPGGNGSDYTWNALPSGWSRIQGAQPQKGDILVYTGGYNNYGHVAIYESDYVTYHQNFNGNYVEKISYKYNGLTTPYWGVIRPDFSNGTVTTSVPKYVGSYWVNLGNGLYRPVCDISNPTSVKYVEFKIWTTGDQSDLKTYSTNYNGETCWFRDINLLNDFKNRIYICHIYIYGKDGSSHGYEMTRLNLNPHTVHEYISNGVVKESTCTEKGTESLKCNICGEKTTKTLDLKPHTEIIDKAVAPTCTKTGLTEGSHCSVCNTVINAQTTVNATGHNFVSDEQLCRNGCGAVNPNYVQIHTHQWDNGIIIKKAGCETFGTRLYSCSGCNETKTENIKPLGHNYITSVVNPTCVDNGYTNYMCVNCGDQYKENYVLITGHSFATTVTQATTTKNGSKVTKCTVCGTQTAKSTIYYPKTITLSATSYTYDGKAKKPTVTVKDSNGKAVSSTNYTVTYSNNTNPGKATAKVTFKGNYSGTVSKTFTIIPKGTSLKTLSATKGGFKATWTKQATQTTGYQIQIATNSGFTKGAKTYTVSSASATSKAISSLTKGKKYYVRIRTYKTVSGTKYYSSWSGYKTVTTKK